MKVVLVLFLLICSLVADDDHHDKKEHHYYGKDLTYLHLTQKQEDILKDILKEYRHDVKKYRKYKKHILDKKQDAFKNSILDTIKLKELNENISKKAIEIEIRFLAEMHQILSEDQRKKFIDYIDEWEIE